jgi:hypothetical protein
VRSWLVLPIYQQEISFAGDPSFDDSSQGKIRLFIQYQHFLTGAYFKPEFQWVVDFKDDNRLDFYIAPEVGQVLAGGHGGVGQAGRWPRRRAEQSGLGFRIWPSAEILSEGRRGVPAHQCPRCAGCHDRTFSSTHTYFSACLGRNLPLAPANRCAKVHTLKEPGS